MKPSGLEEGVGDDGCKKLSTAVDFKVKRGQGRVHTVPWIAMITRGNGCTVKQKSEMMKESGASMLVIVSDEGGYNEESVIPVAFIKEQYLKEIEMMLNSSSKLIPVRISGDVMQPTLLLLALMTPALFFLLVLILWQRIAGPEAYSDESESFLQPPPPLTPAEEQPASLAAVTALPCYPHRQGEAYASECAICLEEFGEGMGVRRVPCGHEFHPGCIDPWLLTKKRKCPVCRKLIEDKKVESHDSSLETRLESSLDSRDTRMDTSNSSNSLPIVPIINQDIQEARKLAWSSRTEDI